MPLPPRIGIDNSGVKSFVTCSITSLNPPPPASQIGVGKSGVKSFARLFN
jgi:hypothetical protein